MRLTLIVTLATLFTAIATAADLDLRPEEQIAPLTIKCASRPLANATVVRDTIGGSTSCATIITTRAGALPVVGNLYHVFATGGTRLFVSLDAPRLLSHYFGLPYIVIADAKGEPLVAKAGLEFADLEFDVPSSGRWLILVTGLGASVSPPAGEYELRADYAPFSLRQRAVRRK